MASSSARRAAASGGSVRFGHLVEGFNPAAAADGPALAAAAPGPHQLQARGGTQGPVRGRPQQPGFRERAARPAPASPRPRRPVSRSSPQPPHPGHSVLRRSCRTAARSHRPHPRRNRIEGRQRPRRTALAEQQTIGSASPSRRRGAGPALGAAASGSQVPGRERKWSMVAAPTGGGVGQLFGTKTHSYYKPCASFHHHLGHPRHGCDEALRVVAQQGPPHSRPALSRNGISTSHTLSPSSHWPVRILAYL